MSVFCQAVVYVLVALPAVGQSQAFATITIKPARSADPCNPRVQLLPNGDCGPCDYLRLLHVRRNHRPIAETISTLLETVRAHAGIALWPNGEQALANCQRLIDMARHFERNASSFRAFVEKLEADAEQGEAGERPSITWGCYGSAWSRRTRRAG